MNIMADEISHNRGKMSLLEKITYQFPPRLSKLEEMPETVRGRLRNDHFVIVTKFHSFLDVSFTFNVPSHTTPRKLLEMILAKMELTKMTEKHKRPSDYILKVCGQDEYLFGEHKLIQFLYIQDMLSRDAVPVLITKPMRSVEVIPETIYGVSELAKPNKPSTATLRKKAHLSSWDLDAFYQIKILQIRGLNCDTNRPVEVGMQAGVFHGGKSLCRIMKTSEKMFSNDGICEWMEDLTFDISVSNMPRNVRLCIVVYETKTSRTQAIRARKLKDSNRDLYITPIAWVNTTIFDYKNSLKTGPVTLYTWNYTEDSQNDDLLNPLGTVERNPRVEECATIIMSFYK
jgi:phosphatidylinositol-4,5-bisphosphate 3-kinase catalytic subunit alpha/beta/delta